MQAHTCAYRKSGLLRAVHPTSGRGIVQNPCSVSLTGKYKKSPFITSHPQPRLRPVWAGLCHVCKELRVSTHLGTVVHTDGVSPASCPAAPPESGVWAVLLWSRRAMAEEWISAQMFREKRTWHIPSRSQHPLPGCQYSWETPGLKHWHCLKPSNNTCYWISLILSFCEIKSNKNTNIRVLFSEVFLWIGRYPVLVIGFLCTILNPNRTH